VHVGAPPDNQRQQRERGERDEGKGEGGGENPDRVGLIDHKSHETQTENTKCPKTERRRNGGGWVAVFFTIEFLEF
jgi:hypothetical protein